MKAGIISWKARLERKSHQRKVYLHPDLLDDGHALSFNDRASSFGLRAIRSIGRLAVAVKNEILAARFIVLRFFSCGNY